MQQRPTCKYYRRPSKIAEEILRLVFLNFSGHFCHFFLFFFHMLICLGVFYNYAFCSANLESPTANDRTGAVHTSSNLEYKTSVVGIVAISDIAWLSINLFSKHTSELSLQTLLSVFF